MPRLLFNKYSINALSSLRELYIKIRKKSECCVDKYIDIYPFPSTYYRAELVSEHLSRLTEIFLNVHSKSMTSLNSTEICILIDRTHNSDSRKNKCYEKTYSLFMIDHD